MPRVKAALRLLALTLVLASGCGGDSPSQAAPEASATTGVCGGEVGSTPSLCRLEVRPSVIGDGQAADVSFGLADLEGDVSELCRLLTPVGGTPVSGACFEVTPVRGRINEIRTLERFLSAGDEDVRSLAPGPYVLSIRVHDRGGWSQPVRAAFTLTATPVPTPTPSPSPAAEPTPQPPPGVVLPPPRPLDGPLGGTVVFQVIEPEGPGSIFAIDPDGRNLRRLGGWSGSTARSLSRDGRRLAFMAPADDAPGSDMEVWVVDTDGTNLRRLTYQGPTGLSSGYDGVPAVSPDGSRVVFESDRAGRVHLWAVNVDGTGLVQLTDGPGGDAHPVYSPDGSRIAFTSRREDRFGELYLMNADGSGETRLTYNESHFDGNPVFSPDGSKLLFTAVRPSHPVFGIYLTNLDGSGETLLTPDARAGPGLQPGRAAARV